MNQLTRAVGCRTGGQLFVFRYHAWHPDLALDAISAAAFDRSCVLNHSDAVGLIRALRAMFEEDRRGGVFGREIEL